MHFCINTFKPTETDGDIYGLDWFANLLVLALSSRLDSLYGLPCAITAQWRL